MPRLPDKPITPGALNKLRWRCRRGLLENDLLIERFFNRFEARLTVSHARGLGELMELSDPDLLDLLLARTEPEAALAGPEALQVLQMLREPPPVRPSTPAPLAAPRCPTV